MERNKRTKRVLTLAAVAMAILSTSAPAATTTISGTDGGDDSWNMADNWDDDVPSGAIDAIVSDGLLVQVNNAATPTYSGSLTLDENSTLKMAGDAGAANAVQGTSGITMHEGSKIQVNMNTNINFPPIALEGNASLESLFGASDHQTDNFSAITGPYTLTIIGFNNHTYIMNAANTFSELVCNAVDRWNIRANAAGSLGTGNVTVTPREDGRSAQLHLDVADTIADTATLTLNGKGYDNTNEDRITIAAGVNETVAGLFVDGVSMAPGTYDNTEVWLSGDGTLTVDDSAEPGEQFKRGDVNADNGVNIADAIALLGHLFGGDPAPVCPDTADANDDGALNIADAIAVLGHLFGGAGPLPAPSGTCGTDPTDDALGVCNYPPENCQ